MERAHFISRAAYIALIAVLVMLVGVSIASAFVMVATSRDAAAAVQRENLFASARFEIGAEESLERKYRLEPAHKLLDAHRSAAAHLTSALGSARAMSGASIRVLVDRVLAMHRRYVASSQRMFVAVDNGDAALALSIDHRDVDPVFTVLQTTVFAEANREKDIANSATSKLLQVAHRVFEVALFVSFVGSAALFAILTVLRGYKVEVDAAIEKEMYVLKKASLTDYLTGLGNHRAYQEWLRDQSLHDRAQDGVLTLALVNVDELKVLNDRRGHVMGDRFLESLGTMLQTVDLQSNSYRLGGDEFALTFAGMAMDVARARMEQLRAKVEADFGGPTVSVGLASMPALEYDPLVLREQADAALREAKRRGRNNTVAFDDIRTDATLFSPSRVAQVRALIDAATIGIEFQPIWNVHGRGLVGYEALARPGGDDPINPQDAFDIAEDIGKAHELDRVCRDAIFARAHTLPAGALLFINVSPQSFDHREFDGTSLVRTVTRAGLTPDRVVLEITERSTARLAEVVREARRLRALGFALALDDAGSGNSGLEMLSQLDVDYVKIDREVIMRAQCGVGGRAVLAGIIAIAHEMGAKIIAEGIENAEMLDLVLRATRSSSIPPAVQGYFVGRPSLEFVIKSDADYALIEHRLASLDLAVSGAEISR